VHRLQPRPRIRKRFQPIIAQVCWNRQFFIGC